LKQSKKSYNAIATIYDDIMSTVDYEGWADYVEDLASLHSCSYNSILDLACGTGSSTIPFAKRGIPATGIDLSAVMIKIARDKTEKEKLNNLRFLEQDLCQLELAEKYDLAVLFQDGLNYLIGTEKLFSAFRNIHQVINPEGLFIFDLTRLKLRPHSTPGRKEIVEDDRFTLFWESNYDHHNHIWSISLTIYCLVENGLYERYYEEHQEQDYSPELISKLLKKTGFTLLGLYPSFSLKPVKADLESEVKLTFVARRI